MQHHLQAAHAFDTHDRLGEPQQPPTCCCSVPYSSSFCLLGGDWGHCGVCLQDLAVSCHPFLREPRGLVSHFKSWVQIPQYWCQATAIDFECIRYASWYAGFPASFCSPWACCCDINCRHGKNPDVVSVFSQAKAAGQDGRVLPVNIWRRVTDGTSWEISGESIRCSTEERLTLSSAFALSAVHIRTWTDL